jgi:plastocyanin
LKSCRLFLLAGALSLLVSCGDSSAPTQPAMTTPTPPPPAGTTPTPVAAHTVGVGQGGNRFVDSQSGNGTTTIRAGESVTWNFVAGPHSATSGNCCSPDGTFDSGVRSSGSFSHTFSSAGTFPYYCTVHGSMMTGSVIVNP